MRFYLQDVKMGLSPVYNVYISSMIGICKGALILLLYIITLMCKSKVMMNNIGLRLHVASFWYFEAPCASMRLSQTTTERNYDKTTSHRFDVNDVTISLCACLGHAWCFSCLWSLPSSRTPFKVVVMDSSQCAVTERLSQWLLYCHGPESTVTCCQFSFNSLRLGWNGRHFADDLIKCIFLTENVWISIKIWMKFVPNVKLTIFQHRFR